MEGFKVERGDVLLSIQMVLTREEEARRRLPGGGVAPNTVRPAAQSATRPSQAVPLRRASAPPPAHPPRPAPSPAPSRSLAAPVGVRSRNRPTGAPVMVDPLTGIGTIHALRRDLMLEQTWPVAGGQAPALWALEVAALDQIRADMGPEAGDQVLKSLVEVAPFALRTEDRVYRSGRNQITLLLPGTDGPAAEAARSSLEAALARRLVGRGYPEVRLSARKLDAVALAS